ncbi:hypothetical protein D3OALGA1CA_1533 [Olavius algarvensis associated proteobacterium Delta 3]|nr:hypothetical protein D3OALGB2SA_334 [Olavius algarvensis associated proteobacterium Delta 3]CAB5102613.1 hypothetical protein D3OALGA1CA_1533 [Olavius algarvensis associated proteobacterium Delta 3]
MDRQPRGRFNDGFGAPRWHVSDELAYCRGPPRPGMSASGGKAER